MCRAAHGPKHAMKNDSGEGEQQTWDIRCGGAEENNHTLEQRGKKGEGRSKKERILCTTPERWSSPSPLQAPLIQPQRTTETPSIAQRPKGTDRPEAILF